MDPSRAVPTVQVTIPHALRSKVGHRRTVMASGYTVREILDSLEHNFPGLGFNLCYETGELRPFVNIFLEGENIRYLQGLDTPVTASATLHILPSVAGG